MKLSYSSLALSLEYPYLVCKIPTSFSDCPFTVVRSSSVSFPHFALIPPFSSCHWPFRISSFISNRSSYRYISHIANPPYSLHNSCLLYTSDAADEEDSVELG